MQGAQTVAVEDGDDYIITGSKVFTTNSGFADTCVVFALTDRSVPAAKGMTAFPRIVSWARLAAASRSP